HLVYNGANGIPQNFEFPAQKENYFLLLSRLHRYKGIHTALEAFQIFSKKHPTVKLRIAGSGPLFSKMHTTFQKYVLLDKVSIAGRGSIASKMDYCNQLNAPSGLVCIESFVSKEKKAGLYPNHIG